MHAHAINSNLCADNLGDVFIILLFVCLLSSHTKKSHLQSDSRLLNHTNSPQKLSSRNSSSTCVLGKLNQCVTTSEITYVLHLSIPSFRKAVSYMINHPSFCLNSKY